MLLDEATSNIDIKTERIVQSVLKKMFKDCTVLTIAHRLNTIADSDKILVMENGKMMEFDSPSVLRKNKNSLFYKLVKESLN